MAANFLYQSIPPPAKTFDEVYAQYKQCPYVSCQFLAYSVVVVNFAPGGCFSSNVSSPEISTTDGFQGFAFNWLLYHFFYKGCKKGLFKLPGEQGEAVAFTDAVRAKMEAAKAKMDLLKAELGSIPDMALYFKAKKETAETETPQGDEVTGEE